MTFCVRNLNRAFALVTTSPVTVTDRTTLKVPVDVSLSFIAIFLVVMRRMFYHPDLKKMFTGLMREHASGRGFHCYFTSVTVRQCICFGKGFDFIRSLSGHTINRGDTTQWYVQIMTWFLRTECGSRNLTTSIPVQEVIMRDNLRKVDLI